MEDSTIAETVPVNYSEEKSRKLRELNGLHYNIIEFQFKALQGDILTLIDATFSDTAQRKAQKDLVNSMFRRKFNYISDLCYSTGGQNKFSAPTQS